MWAMAGDGFREIVQTSSDLYLVLAVDLVIEEASEGYLRATGTTRDAILGRHLFDVFPAEPGDAGAAAEAAARASFARVIEDRGPHELGLLRYPLPRPDGSFAERYWRILNRPLFAADGHVARIVQRAEDVTDVMQLERDKLRYVNLFDSAPDAIVIVATDNVIELVNHQTEALFGYTRAELVGQPLEVLIPDRFRAGHHRHTDRYFALPSTRPMGTGLELCGRRKDGSELPIEVSLSPQHSDRGMRVAASIRDISERRRLEQATNLLAQRLRSAVDSIADAVALFDRGDRLLLCNSTFRSLIGEAVTGDLVGLPYEQILDGWIGSIDLSDAERARFRSDRLARHATEDTSTFDVTLRDGRSLRVVDRKTPEGGMVKTILDRTDDEARARELREARAAAEAASAAKSEFLSSMSHELRTPLNAILGFAQLLGRDKREPLSARHRERTEHILRGGEHLLRLIDDILDLARIEAGKVTISLEPVAVPDVLEELRRTLEPIAARQRVKLEIEACGAVAAITADRTRFSQILMNLGSNAIKYNRPGGEVRFSVANTAPGMVRVTVSDNGVGIPLAEQTKLFQPFQRAGQENGPIEGTGIGLVITRRLARLMNGEVGFTSVPGEGSRFWVDLPPDRDGGGPLTVEAVHAADLPAGDHLILYVEDNPANVRFMADLMSTIDNVELVSLPTAELGIELARARRPALILMDINLPGMSGIEALHALETFPETAEIPVIALTAAAAERDRARGREAGFYQYLTKPVKVDELIAAIETVLRAPR